MDAAGWIERLALRPNPEGGHFAALHEVPHPGRHEAPPLLTVIHYLLDARAPRARLHRNGGAALHYHHLGGALTIHTVDDAGVHRTQRLGAPFDRQALVPGGVWKAIELSEGPWALISEAVVPGWTPESHTSATPDLLATWPPDLAARLAPFIDGADSAHPDTNAAPILAVAPPPAPHDIAAAHLRAALHLASHVEGGYYRETWSAADHVDTPRGPRVLANTIYYLLDTASPRGRLHRCASDITHFFHAGGPIRYALIDPDGGWHELDLGPDPDAGHRLAFTCPGGWWKASHLLPGVEHGLVSEVVAPGFDFADHELARRDRMHALHPHLRERWLPLVPE